MQLRGEVGPWVIRGSPLPAPLRQLMAPGWLVAPTLAGPLLFPGCCRSSIHHLQGKRLVWFPSHFLPTWETDRC